MLRKDAPTRRPAVSTGVISRASLLRAFLSRASLIAYAVIGLAIFAISPNSYASFPVPSYFDVLDGGNNNDCYSATNQGGNTIWGPCPGVESKDTDTLCREASQAFASPPQANPALLSSPGTVINMTGTAPTRTATCQWVYNGFASNHPMRENAAACPQNSTGTTTCTCNDDTLQLSQQCIGGKNNGVPLPGEEGCCVANPINPGTGNKLEPQAVYRGVSGFEMKLTYNSMDYVAIGFGSRWHNWFDRRVVLDDPSNAVVLRGDGRAVPFTSSGGTWNADPQTTERLVELTSGGTRTGWQFTSLNADEVETFDASGKLLTIAARSGLTQSLQYSDGTGGANGGFVLDSSGNPTTTPLPAGLLIKASDAFGRALSLGYDAASHVTRLTDPAGGVYQFAYDASANLTSITLPGGAVRTFIYNEAANTGGASLVNALTGITDENSARFATFKYDAQEHTVSSEHAGSVELYTLVYNADGSATVTDPRGNARMYSYSTIYGATKNTAITGAACPTCGPASQSRDANGNVNARIDWDGNRTNYSYDLARNLQTQRVEGLTSTGATTPQTRTISTQWNTTWRLPAVVAEPLRITTNTYDSDGTACGAKGGLCSRTVQATSDTDGSAGFGATAVGSPRTWTYTYNANGSVLTVNGPRTDVSDVTTYTYYANDDADAGKRGNVATITNAAGHVTQMTAYNAHGQPLTIVDPNGLTTTLTYDARERLTSRNVGGETTSYGYDGVGQLTKVTLPDGSYLSYTYDDAHRLIAIQDNLGNRISYTLDVMGNRTQEQVYDPANVLAQTRSRVYNSLNRLFQELGAQSQTTEYTYDDQGNVVSVKDPLLKVTANQYDALNRLKQVTDPSNGVTQYSYNGQDALTQVTDPRSLSTAYTVDGLGNLTAQASPDTGATSNTYDAAGNLLTQTDAKGQVTTYTYDALNRVTLITFNDGSKQAYAYDLGTNGLGRLSSITETNAANQQTSLIQFAYDQHGRVTSETRTVAGVSYAVGYTYDSFGRVSGMTYPSGRTVTYAFDSLGRVNQVSTTKDAQSTVLVQNVQYQPFGAVKSFTLGNGQIYSRTIDTDGRIASYNLGATSFALAFDASSRITGIGTSTYGYDNLDRLTSAVLSASNYGYTYDAVGNRLTKTTGANTDSYAYDTASNRLAMLTPAGGTQRSFAFDADGSTTSDGLNTYSYDVRGRMVQATSGAGTSTYQVNALGQRVKKSASSGDTVFHYDARGRLIAETDAAGAVKRELFYLGDIPVAVYQ